VFVVIVVVVVVVVDDDDDDDDDFSIHSVRKVLGKLSYLYIYSFLTGVTLQVATMLHTLRNNFGTPLVK
jgi:hypothetical protein